MSQDHTVTPTSIPADDLERSLGLARPDSDQVLPHIGLAGDTYTVLLSGAQTAGRYTLIDMHVPTGGGPAPHRHDFEEMFTVVDGEIDATFRDHETVVRTGETINIPANAPHSFTNSAQTPARLLCVCSPAGQEEFFEHVGVPVATRTTAAPKLDQAQQAEFLAKARQLAPTYRTELLGP